MKIKIEPATPDRASHIASLIMEAMNPGCCQNLAGAHHTLAEFHQVMERLVRMEDSQYSYRNTLLATIARALLLVSSCLTTVHSSRRCASDSSRRLRKPSASTIQEWIRKRRRANSISTASPCLLPSVARVSPRCCSRR